jgi:hypothetical protein
MLDDQPFNGSRIQHTEQYSSCRNGGAAGLRVSCRLCKRTSSNCNEEGIVDSCASSASRVQGSTGVTPSKANVRSEDMLQHYSAHLMLQLGSQLWLSSAMQGYNARPCRPDPSLLLLLPASNGLMAMPFNTNWPRHFSNAAGLATAAALLLLPPSFLPLC